MATRSTSLIAVSLAGLFLATNLAGLAHHAATRHVRCPEHDELIHVGEARLDPGALVVAGDAVTPATTGAGGSHAHCKIPILSRARMATVTSVVASHAADGVAAVAWPETDDDRSPAALYRLAPKTSPPA